jgi:hypothetical protein
VHPHRDAAGTGGDVIARQRALAALVELPLRVQRERMRGDGLTFVEWFAEVHIFVLPPRPVLRERAGGEGDFERREPFVPEITLILTFSRRTGRRDQSAQNLPSRASK